MARARKQGRKAERSKGANLGFEQKLWAAADKLRGHMDAAEYKHVVLGLIFLKYISDAFEERRSWLGRQTSDPASDYYLAEEQARYQVLEDRDEYTAENVFWVPLCGQLHRPSAGPRHRGRPARDPPGRDGGPGTQGLVCHQGNLSSDERRARPTARGGTDPGDAAPLRVSAEEQGARAVDTAELLLAPQIGVQARRPSSSDHSHSRVPAAWRPQERAAGFRRAGGVR